MIDISKEFITMFLDIVNLNSDSHIRSKKGYGIFEIIESIDNVHNKVYMELVYIPTRVNNQPNKSCIRKVYNLEIAPLDDFRSAFYQEVVNYLTGSKNATNLINYGEY
jgi:hypothetical protein